MEFTTKQEESICKNLGWQGNGGCFDVLPLVIQYKGDKPELFEIPDDIVLRVKLTHPNFPKFGKLDLEWYAVPIISSMSLDVGGLEFTCAPFNGWYMVTEISTRNLIDKQRYDLLQPIAKSFDFDTSTTLNLWKDKTAIELTSAVLHSFAEARVTIVDHHSASDQFSEHVKYENSRRGGCPADWVWIVPPISGCLTSVFHQEMLCYNLKPSFNYLENPWKYQQKRAKKFSSFKNVSRVVLVCIKLMLSYLKRRPQLTVLYGTETGHAKKFAKHVNSVFSETFYTSFSSMDEYTFNAIADGDKKTFIIIVTSTFGNGEAPSNAEHFHSELKRMVSEDDLKCTQQDNWVHISFNEGKILQNYKYAVFALGSGAYPDFCAFGHEVNGKLRTLGATEICQIGEGDELSGQEDTFLEWLDECYANACVEFSVNSDSRRNSILKGLGESGIDTRGEWKNTKFRIVRAQTRKREKDICAKLSSTHKIPVFQGKIISVENQQSLLSPRKTNLVRLDIKSEKVLKGYEIGDSLAVFPENPPKEVNRLLKKFRSSFDPDEPIVLQFDVNFENETREVSWTNFDRFDSPTTLTTIMERYVDITTPPTQSFLRSLVEKAAHPSDIDALTQLTIYEEDYNEWKSSGMPTIADTLEEFSSVAVSATFLITQLPLMLPRFYSISSSPRPFPDEIHLTVALLSYDTQGEGFRRKGVCSSWLDRLNEDDIVPCYLKKSNRLRLPQSTEPIIIVGPGTGIAPFRAFWQDLTFKSKQSQNGLRKQLPEVSLYTGCRSPQEDFLFQEEIRKAHEAGIIAHVHCAFSRAKATQKMYVQHMMKQNAREIHRVLCKDNGHVFVCGGIEMAKDVKETLYEIIKECSKLPTEEAVEIMDSLKVNGRYHEEVFGLHHGFSNQRRRVGRRQSMHPSRTLLTLPWLVETEKFASSL